MQHGVYKYVNLYYHFWRRIVLARIGQDRKVVTEEIKDRKMKHLAHKIRENGITGEGTKESIERKKVIGANDNQLISQLTLQDPGGNHQIR